MTAILIHVGCVGPYISSTAPPPHLEHCINQYLLFNTGLHVLTDRVNIPLIAPRPGLTLAAIEDYYSDKIARFHSVFNYDPKEFWTTSTTRLFYLENYMRQNDLRRVVHFENDVLVYFNVASYAGAFGALCGDIGLAPCDPDHLTTGFMYIDNYSCLERMTNWFVSTVATHGVDGACKHHRIDMVNDMTLMKRYADTDGAPHVNILPTLPDDERWYLFGGLFDGAGWGQYICGTQAGGPGMSFPGHVVGGALRAHPEWKIEWRVEDGLRFPYLNYGDGVVKFNNLHCHSKNMIPYMSRNLE